MANDEKSIINLTNLDVSFALDGKTYKFNVNNMKRNQTTAAGIPIYVVDAYEQKTGRRAVVDLGADWTVRGLIVDTSFTLRNKIADAKEFYLSKYAVLGWQWTDEGLPNAIMDYESSVPLSDFTEDDWKVCDENGWKRAEVEELCRED